MTDTKDEEFVDYRCGGIIDAAINIEREVGRWHQDMACNQVPRETSSISRILNLLEMSNPKCIYMEAEDRGDGFEWTYQGIKAPDFRVLHLQDCERFTDSGCDGVVEPIGPDSLEGGFKRSLLPAGSDNLEDSIFNADAEKRKWQKWGKGK